MTADANSLVNYARQVAQGHLFSFNEDIPVEQLTQRLCDLKQGYTQYGGLSLLFLSFLCLILLNQSYYCVMNDELQVCDRLAFPCSMRGTIHIINSSYTTRTRQGTTLAGRRPASAPIMERRRACLNKITRTK